MTEQTSNDDNPASGDLSGEVEFIAAERLIFFSDAVVAIAMTLLALSLTPPLLAASATNRDVLAALWTPERHLEYLAFLISFAVIANHWRSHHRLFRYVSRLDQRIISLNLVWLFMIVVTPFASRLLSGNGGFGVRFGLYAVVQLFTMISFLLMSRHIRGNALLRPDAPPAVTNESDDSWLVVAVFFALSIPFAFIPAIGQWAFAFWVVGGFATRARQRRRDQRLLGQRQR
jgi:uncharacterized membrane protein